MITTKTAFVEQGKLIQIMGDTEVLESYQLEADEKATVVISVEKVPLEKAPPTE